MSTQGCRIASASDLRLYRLYRGRVAVYGKNPHFGAISFSAAGEQVILITSLIGSSSAVRFFDVCKLRMNEHRSISSTRLRERSHLIE